MNLFKLSISLLLIPIMHLNIFAQNLNLIPISPIGSPLFIIIQPASELFVKEKFQTQLSYENRFSLNELSPKSFCGLIQLKKHLFLVGFSTLGSEFFNTQNIYFTYRFKIDPRWNAGMTFKSQIIQQKTIGELSSRFVSVIGTSFKYSSNLQLFGSFAIKIGENNFDFGLNDFAIGAKYQIFENLNLLCYWSSNQLTPSVYHLGLDYKANSAHGFRITMSNKHIPISFSYLLNWKKHQVNLGINYHLQLGMSNPITLQLNF